MEITLEEWKRWTARKSTVHLLQTAEWGMLKANFDWQAVYCQSGEMGAMILFRKLAPGITIAYIPRGPVGVGEGRLDQFWQEVHAICRRRKAVFLRVEPDIWQGSALETETLNSLQGFAPAFATIQPPRTMIIPLDGAEEEWLARMNQKTRYNIRISQKKDLTIDESADCKRFCDLMALTGSRDSFSVHSPDYYQKCMDIFRPAGMVHLLSASYNGVPLGALMLFICGKRGYYLYGASSNEERNRMPNHLLQWSAMKRCKEYGCTEYDLWGIPDAPPEQLEAEFETRKDGLWSVYRFKRGFGGQIRRTIGSYDYVYQPLAYQALRLATKIRNKKL